MIHKKSIKKHKFLPLSVIFFSVMTCLSFAYLNAAIEKETKVNFWHATRKGTNVFNKEITRADIKAAKAYGIEFIRLAPDKFFSKQRDFLIGNADHYTQIFTEDLEYLKSVLDLCHEEGMPIVLTMLSLPGTRWAQNNADKDDLRIWTNHNFQEQAAMFWQNLAAELKDHPAIVGYNILNEPHIERLYDSSAIHIHEIHQLTVQSILFDFYQVVISSIREVDPDTSIILDSTAYADPQTFEHFIPHNENNILYSFHMYEPYEYTNEKINQGNFTYPGYIQGRIWDKKTLENYMQAVVDFQKNHNIPSSQILVGEFGGHRTSKGLPHYFHDLIEIFKENGWHFAFYAFREDVWDGMDYELGDQKLPWSYWQALEKGDKTQLDRNSTHPQFKVLQDHMYDHNNIVNA